jgi:hypothetical protein
LRVPELVHLLFLPAYWQELRPAEHLWPLTNAALVNRHVITIGELGEARRVLRRRTAAVARSDPLDDAHPLVARAHPQTTGARAKVV